jgi:hypothetical protein
VPADEPFVPLAVWLRGPVAGAMDVPPADAPPEDVSCVDVPMPMPEPVPALVGEALRDVRLFRARLADALDAATARLVRELAYAVLGRELILAPADLAALAERILAEHPAATPVAIRHAPGEGTGLPLPGVADPALAPGDLIVSFAAGAVDARLGVRLAVALEAWS